MPSLIELAAAAGDDIETDPPAAPFAYGTIRRLRSEVDPIAQLRASALPHVSGGRPPVTQPAYARPDGSFGARAVGRAIHVFLERLSSELAQGIAANESATDAADRLLQDIPAWNDAIHATLRAGGLPRAASERAVTTVLRALQGMLTEPDCRWVLLPHRAGATESAWRSVAGEGARSVRMDRSFFAGDVPRQTGDDGTFWIVDFKTGDHEPRTADTYLAGERVKYEPQLATYAEVMRTRLPDGTRIMLALCYPLMGRLTCWPFEKRHENEPVEVTGTLRTSAPQPQTQIQPQADMQPEHPAPEEDTFRDPETEPEPERNKKGQLQLFG
jgi:hypothetical protein